MYVYATACYFSFLLFSLFHNELPQPLCLLLISSLIIPTKHFLCVVDSGITNLLWDSFVGLPWISLSCHKGVKNITLTIKMVVSFFKGTLKSVKKILFCPWNLYMAFNKDSPNRTGLVRTFKATKCMGGIWHHWFHTWFAFQVLHRSTFRIQWSPKVSRGYIPNAFANSWIFDPLKSALP